jgi:hypothetical protein
VTVDFLKKKNHIPIGLIFFNKLSFTSLKSI